MGGERATLFIVDASSRELTTRRGGVLSRVPANRGLLGAAAGGGRGGCVVRVASVRGDARFDAGVDGEPGVDVAACLAVPVRAGEGGAEGPVVGVLRCVGPCGVMWCDVMWCGVVGV